MSFDDQMKAKLKAGPEADPALLHLLAKVAYSDGDIHNQELRFVGMFLPHLSDEELTTWVQRQGAEPLDFRQLSLELDSVENRWLALRFAAKMAWKDEELAPEEEQMLAQLAAGLDLGPDAVARVIHEMNPLESTRYEGSRILRALFGIRWEKIFQLASGAVVSSDLAAVLPMGEQIVARVGLEKVEVLVFVESGFAARFRQGAAFLPFAEVMEVRPMGLGDVQVLTASGRSYNLVDRRFEKLAQLITRLREPEEPAV